MTNNEQDTLRVLTIGHSNHAWEHFVNLLQANHVEVVAEGRSYPYSTYAPQFDREPMKDALAKCGVKYVDLGRELGGRPGSTEFYDVDGHGVYYKGAATERVGEGNRRVGEGMKQ